MWRSKENLPCKLKAEVVETDEQQPRSVNLWGQDSNNRTITRSHESRHVSKLTTAANCKTWLDAIMIIRCQGNDTCPFSTSWNFPFLEKREIQFFPKKCTVPLFLSLFSPSHTKSPVLRWPPVLSRFYPRVQRSNKNTSKQSAVNSLR